MGRVPPGRSARAGVRLITDKRDVVGLIHD